MANEINIHGGSSPFRAKSGLGDWARRVLRLMRKTCFRLQHGQKLKLGKNVTFGGGCLINAPTFMHVGNDVSFGRNVTIENNITIGDGVLISSNVAFVGNDHNFESGMGQNVFWQGRLPDSHTVLEGDNLIGFGTIVIGPVTIGRGCIVGAGSVVTKNLPADSICAGVPAKVIRPRKNL